VTVAALGGADTINAGVGLTGRSPSPSTAATAPTRPLHGTNADDTIASPATARPSRPSRDLAAGQQHRDRELTVKGLGGADTITGQNGIGR
jgi:hypothetical protein